METYPSSDSLILPSELPSYVYRKLSTILCENNSWEKIANYVYDYGLISDEEMSILRRSSQPAEQLLNELGMRLCNVESLCAILEECQLFNVLLLFRPHEPIFIEEQPFGSGDDNSTMVERGRTLRLTCKARGLPPPSYHWFQDDDELPDYQGSCLVIHDFGLENEGDYYCILKQEGFGSICSTVVAVTLAPERPVILHQPRLRCDCRWGHSLEISVQAKGHPQLSYEWYQNDKLLDGYCNSTLIIDNMTRDEEGEYRCFVRNNAGEEWSDPCLVTVFASPEDLTEDPQPVASAKVALLIGNQEYENMSRLITPEEDVRTVADLLARHDFQVIALQNLTLLEMKNAIKELCNLLPKGAYVVFYYAGHGFNLKDKYMLPVSTPSPERYLKADALSEEELLRPILDKEPQVLLEMLDMCLKSPEMENKAIYQEVPQLHEYKSNCNLIQAYSTTSYAGAYERETDKNGLFVKSLKKYLMEDISIVTLLTKALKGFKPATSVDFVIVDMEQEKQSPYLGMNVTRTYRLSDPCARCDHVRETIESFLKVPEIHQLTFENVDLDSMVTCSPYLNVFCNTIQLTFTNIDKQKFKVACAIHDTEIVQSLERQGKDLVVTLRNLQRLKKETMLTIELQTKDTKLVDAVAFNLGLPMIAPWNLWCLDENVGD